MRPVQSHSNVSCGCVPCACAGIRAIGMGSSGTNRVYRELDERVAEIVSVGAGRRARGKIREWRETNATKPKKVVPWPLARLGSARAHRPPCPCLYIVYRSGTAVRADRCVYRLSATTPLGPSTRSSPHASHDASLQCCPPHLSLSARHGHQPRAKVLQVHMGHVVATSSPTSSRLLVLPRPRSRTVTTHHT